jgi:hypothetical protein
MMDNAKVEEQYKLYKLRQAEKDQEKTAEKQENERKRAEKDAFWKAKVEQANRKIVTCRIPHKCADCGALIPAGSRVHVRAFFGNIAVNGGYTAGFESRYYCTKCRPTKRLDASAHVTSVVK